MVRDAARSLSSGRALRGPVGAAPHHEADRVRSFVRWYHSLPQRYSDASEFRPTLDRQYTGNAPRVNRGPPRGQWAISPDFHGITKVPRASLRPLIPAALNSDSWGIPGALRA